MFFASNYAATLWHGIENGAQEVRCGSPAAAREMCRGFLAILAGSTMTDHVVHCPFIISSSSNVADSEDDRSLVLEITCF